MVDREFEYHTSCPKCPSSDGFAMYDNDEYGKCFVCGHYQYFKESDERREPVKKAKKTPVPMPDDPTWKSMRGITATTMEKLKYAVGEYQGEAAHLVTVPFPDGRGHAATKIRMKGKEFRFVGDTKDCGLVFQNIWQSGGKKVVVTEGEFDALSVSQAQDNKWPVVSLPNGAHGAGKSCTSAFKWLNSFEEIVLWFDDDAVGREAVDEVAKLFDVGKVKVVTPVEGYKDANELLKAGKVADIINAMWRAQPYSPARFVSFGSLKQEGA